MGNNKSKLNLAGGIKLTDYDQLMSLSSIESNNNPRLSESVLIIDNFSGNLGMIKKLILATARNYCAIGYYLKQIRDTGQYRQAGYKDIWEMAKAELGFSESATSRHININDEFSIDGNSLELADKYKSFGKSHLQEMLALPDEIRADVRPDMTVKEIRKLKPAKNDEPLPVSSTAVELTPVGDQLPGQMDANDFFDANGDFSGFGETSLDACPGLSAEEIQGLNDFIAQNRPVFKEMAEDWKKKDPRTYYKKHMALRACGFMLSHFTGKLHDQE
ncbi:MAG: hypothetical protein FWG91_10225 [Lachnospiraceae bacterium]|nr:hypothetical protein [Lachnospiraceae bacterium]